MQPGAATSPAFARRIGSACHDLRTPLATVYGFARTIERMGGLDERQGRYLDLVIEAARDLERLILAVATLSRIEMGELKLEPEQVDLRELALRAAEKADDALGPDRQVESRAMGPGSRVVVDVRHAIEALALLAEAALRLAPERNSVALEVGEDATIRVEPISSDTVGVLLRDSRDLRVATARALLEELGATASAEDGAFVVSFAPAT